MVTLTLDIPRLAPGLNALRGMHYHTYRKLRDVWQALVRASAGRSRFKGRVRIAIERRYARNPLDLDNLYASAKIPLDALQRAGIIPNDNPEILVSLSCTQRKVPKTSMEGTTIEITEA